MAINIPRFDFKRTMYIVGGIGVILWGIGSVILRIISIVIIGRIIVTPYPIPSSIQSYILFSLLIVTYIFFMLAYLITVVFGVRLLKQKFSWQLAFVFLLIYALAILMQSVVFFYEYSQQGASTPLNYGILLLISSIFILIGIFLARFSEFLSTKIIGIIFGLVSIILLMVSYYSFLNLISHDIPKNYPLLNPLPSTLGYVAIIYALIIGMIAVLLRSSVIGKLILGMIIIAPLLYGISISIDNFNNFSFYTTLLSQIPQGPAPELFTSINTYILAAILGVAGGLLIVIGSGLGLGHTIIEGINLLSKRTPTAP